MNPVEMQRGVLGFRRQVGGSLLRARNKAGMSQQGLAGLAGISVAAVSYIERGERSCSLDNVYRLALSLGLTPAQLIQVKGESH